MNIGRPDEANFKMRDRAEDIKRRRDKHIQTQKQKQNGRMARRRKRRAAFVGQGRRKVQGGSKEDKEDTRRKEGKKEGKGGH